MAAPQLLTYYDVVVNLMDFCGHTSAASQRDIRRAVHSAYRDILAAKTWRCLLKPFRIHMHAAEEVTGTYDHTGGASERLVSLSAGTFDADWAEDAYIRIDDIVCAIETRIDSTSATLDATMNPGADVASATFTVYPAYYILPHDFQSFSGPWSETYWHNLTQVSPAEYLALDRYYDSDASPRWYCVMAVPDLYGSLGLFLQPASDADTTIDFMYNRRPRQLRYSGHDATVDTVGTITVAAGSATVTGSGTAADEAMVGSIIRIGTGSTNVPTGLDGLYPYGEERTITAVASATSWTLDANIATTRSGVKYCISDPIDLHYALFNAFMRGCEKQIAFTRNMENKGETAAMYEDALFHAKCADCPITQSRIAGGGTHRVWRLSDGGFVTNE